MTGLESTEVSASLECLCSVVVLENRKEAGFVNDATVKCSNEWLLRRSSRRKGAKRYKFEYRGKRQTVSVCKEVRKHGTNDSVGEKISPRCVAAAKSGTRSFCSTQTKIKKKR